MQNKRFKINTWLERMVRKFRKEHSEKILCLDYRELTAWNLDITWEDYLASRALCYAIEKKPFMSQAIWDTDLSDDTKYILHNMYIDTVADLMQFSVEELEAVSRTTCLDVDAVRQYLVDHHLRLMHNTNVTYKLSSVLAMSNPKGNHHTQAPQVIENPSLALSFNPNRPSTYSKWLDEFYKKYIYIENEEQLNNVLKFVKWEFDEDKGYDDAYDSLLEAQKLFWKNYKSVCKSHHIKQEVSCPRLPKNLDDLDSFTNDKLLILKKESTRAVISALKQGISLNNCSFADYFEADDDGKLEILESESDKKLLLMMTACAETMIDFEIVLIELCKKLKRDASQDAQFTSEIPINPWLAEQIQTFRKKHTIQELRKKYKQELVHNPHKLWPMFIAEQALSEAAIGNPNLRKHLYITGLDSEITDRLETEDVRYVCDLIQLTKYEIDMLFNGEFDDFDQAVYPYPIYDFLSKYGLKPYDAEGRTYRVHLPANKNFD